LGFSQPMMYYAKRDGWCLDLSLHLSPYLRMNLEKQGAHERLSELEKAKDLSPWLHYFLTQDAKWIVVNKSREGWKEALPQLNRYGRPTFENESMILYPMGR